MVYLSLVLFVFSFAFAGKGESVKTYPWKDSATPVKIVTIDKNGDGRPERVEKYFEERKIKRLIKRVEKNGKSYVMSFPLYEEDAACFPAPVISTEAAGLTDTVLNNVGLEGDFLLTGTGQKIHRSCLQKWGRDPMLSMVRDAATQGLQCLERLAQQSTTYTNMAATLAGELRESWSAGDNVSVICHDDARSDWQSTNAYASSSPENVAQVTPAVRHPFVSINPTYPAALDLPETERLDKMSSIVFHEMIHNKGHKHGDGVEVTYGCQTCCSSSSSAEEKTAACKICVGDYQNGGNDLQYLRDLITWQKIPGSRIRGDIPRLALIRYMNETGDRRGGMIQMVRANPVGSSVEFELAGELDQLFPRESRTEEEDMVISVGIAMRNYPPTQTHRAQGAVIAKAMVKYFYQQDIEGAIREFSQNESALRELIVAGDAPNAPYNSFSTAAHFKEVAMQIWLHQQNNDPKKGTDTYLMLKRIGVLN